MSRSLIGFLFLTVLVTSVPTTAQPVRERPPAPAEVDQRADEARQRIEAARERARAARQKQAEKAAERQSELEAMTDQQLAMHARELAEKSGLALGEAAKARTEWRELETQYKSAEEGQRPELYVRRIEARAKQTVLERKAAELHRSMREAMDEQSRRHQESLAKLTAEQLRGHLVELAAKRDAAKRQYEEVRTTAAEEESGANAAAQLVRLECDQLERQLHDAEETYLSRLTGEPTRRSSRRVSSSVRRTAP